MDAMEIQPDNRDFIRQVALMVANLRRDDPCLKYAEDDGCRNLISVRNWVDPSGTWWLSVNVHRTSSISSLEGLVPAVRDGSKHDRVLFSLDDPRKER